jgi:hypothetical protein
MILLAPLFNAAWFFIDASPVTLKLPIMGTLTVPWFTLLLSFSSLLSGSVFAAIGIYQLNMLTSVVPREGRTTAMAVHWSLVGLSSALAPLVAGVIKDFMTIHPVPLALYHGTGFSFMHVLLILHTGLLWLIALPLAKRLESVPTDMTVVRTLAHIFITNPLRIARDIYGFNGVIVASAAKAKTAVRQSAGKAKGAIHGILNNDKNGDDPSKFEKEVK